MSKKQKKRWEIYEFSRFLILNVSSNQPTYTHSKRCAILSSLSPGATSRHLYQDSAPLLSATISLCHATQLTSTLWVPVWRVIQQLGIHHLQKLILCQKPNDAICIETSRSEYRHYTKPKTGWYGQHRSHFLRLVHGCSTHRPHRCAHRFAWSLYGNRHSELGFLLGLTLHLYALKRDLGCPVSIVHYIPGLPLRPWDIQCLVCVQESIYQWAFDGWFPDTPVYTKNKKRHCPAQRKHQHSAVDVQTWAEWWLSSFLDARTLRFLDGKMGYNRCAICIGFNIKGFPAESVGFHLFGVKRLCLFNQLTECCDSFWPSSTIAWKKVDQFHHIFRHGTLGKSIWQKSECRESQ